MMDPPESEGERQLQIRQYENKMKATSRLRSVIR